MFCYTLQEVLRDVAQFGSALGWGSSGRRFKSCHPDHHELIQRSMAPLFLCRENPPSIDMWKYKGCV